MAHFVYILFCDQKTFYIGSTDNIERRLAEHKSGKSFYTRQFSDVTLVYKEEFETRIKAEKREKQVKGWSVAKKKALISGDVGTLVALSKSTEAGKALLPDV